MSAMTSNRPGCPFTIVSVPWGENGMQRQAARYECCTCRAKIDYSPRTGTNTLRATDVHRKYLMQKGWLLNGRATEATCPECQGKKAKAPETPTIPNFALRLSQLEPSTRLDNTLDEWSDATPNLRAKQPPRPVPVKAILKPASDTDPGPRIQVAPIRPPMKVQPPAPQVERPAAEVERPAAEVAPVETAAPPTANKEDGGQKLEQSIPPTVTGTTSQPDNEQRLKIRFALDQHFDDKIGEYLGNESDESIAASLDVPLEWVTTIRDVGYGPLRQTPEERRRKLELAAIRATITDLQQQLDAALERLTRLETLPPASVSPNSPAAAP